MRTETKALAHCFTAWAGLALLGNVTACGLNDCDFVEQRCDGNVVETCGGGPDQMLFRKIVRTPCVAPNNICVEGLCVYDPVTTCSGPESRCVGRVALSCNGRYIVADDCSLPGSYGSPGTEFDRTCVVDGGSPGTCQQI